MTRRRAPKPPEYLRPATRKWWSSVLEDYELAEHHVRLLTAAGEAWDRREQAREAIRKHGLTFLDRFDSPRPRPEIGIERDSRLAFARLLRELDLDVDAPAQERSRPAALRSNRR